MTSKQKAKIIKANFYYQNLLLLCEGIHIDKEKYIKGKFMEEETQLAIYSYRDAQS